MKEQETRDLLYAASKDAARAGDWEQAHLLMLLHDRPDKPPPPASAREDVLKAADASGTLGWLYRPKPSS